MLGKLGPGEIILIVGVALLIFGPAKLPELGRAVGKGIREFRGAMKETTESITQAVKEEAAAEKPAESAEPSEKKA